MRVQKEDLKNMGSRISARRKELRLTQEQLAERMGVSVQMVSNLERGNKAVKIDNLIRLCEVLSISSDYVLTGKHTAGDTGYLSERLSLLTERDYKMIEMIVDYRLSAGRSPSGGDK